MVAKYHEITFEEFDSVMEAYGFECLNERVDAREFVFALRWHDSHYACKVYSSITGTGVARARGTDAIRVLLLCLIDDEYKCVFKTRVYRVQGWRNNLQDRIDECFIRGCMGEICWCENCGAPMVLREGRGAFFYGCSSYGDTGCTYTKGFEGDSNNLSEGE